jgi:FkbM family methyltransferase
MYFKTFIIYLKAVLIKYYNPAAYKNVKKMGDDRIKFYSRFIRKDDLVFDVGANLGNRVEPLLAIGAKVVAAEPQSLCYNYLKLRFGNKITLLKTALGAKTYQSTIRLNSESTTISSMSDEWINTVKETRFKNLDWDKTENVSVDTLDNLIKKYGIPKFIKIDVEGFEAEVLKGLSQSIPIICFEYTTPERLQNMLECLDLLDLCDKNYVYNYSAGESNTFALEKWLSINELKEIINGNIDLLEGFGDIYATQTNFKINPDHNS